MAFASRLADVDPARRHDPGRCAPRVDRQSSPRGSRAGLHARPGSRPALRARARPARTPVAARPAPRRLFDSLGAQSIGCLGMKRDAVRGRLELLLLAVLAAGPAHGYKVIQQLRTRSGGTFDLPEG